MRGKISNLVGQRFGRLTVIERYPSSKNSYRTRWLCKCDCGNSKIARVDTLQNGGCKSCGCLFNEHRVKNGKIYGGWNKLPGNQAAINFIYKSYKSGARKRGLEFKLLLDKFIELISQDCFYCRSKPNNSYKELLYNGIDRLDNNAGYTFENCVPCCWLCNRMKLSLDIRHFTAHIQKIYNNMVSEGVLPKELNDLWTD